MDPEAPRRGVSPRPPPPLSSFLARPRPTNLGVGNGNPSWRALAAAAISCFTTVGRAISCWEARSTKWEVQSKGELRANAPLPAMQSTTKPPDAQGNAGSLPVSMKTNGQSERRDRPGSILRAAPSRMAQMVRILHSPKFKSTFISSTTKALFAKRSYLRCGPPDTTYGHANGGDFLDATSIMAPGCVRLDLRVPELGGARRTRRQATEIFERACPAPVIKVP